MLSDSQPSVSTLSCVVPCLNEAPNLAVLLPALVAALEPLAQRYEIIVVDDGSTDGTCELLTHWATQNPNVVYLQLSRNFGKESALTAGLQAAKGQAVVCIDADLQHPPAIIASMVERWKQGADMVYAVRATRHAPRRIIVQALGHPPVLPPDAYGRGHDHAAGCR